MTGVKIKLSSYEMMTAAHIGIMRQVSNVKKGRKDANNAPIEQGWQYHIEGAMGECAVARFLGLYWNGNMGHLEMADVGDVEVRTASSHGYRLILHPSDEDDSIFVLATGLNGEYWLRGWTFGKVAKQQIYWEDPVGGRPAFFFPISNLSPMKSLVAE